MVIAAADDGVDPVCELRHHGKGIWVEARATASPDEGVNPVDESVADQGPTRVPLHAEPGEVRRLYFQSSPSASFRGYEVLPGVWLAVQVAAAQVGAGWGLRGGLQILTKQMPARRRSTRVHTFVGRQRNDTTVTLSSCRTLASGWLVPSRPHPMATHCTPTSTPWPCSGSRATCTLVLMAAEPLSCGGQERAPKSHIGLSPLRVCFPI